MSYEEEVKKVVLKSINKYKELKEKWEGISDVDRRKFISNVCEYARTWERDSDKVQNLFGSTFGHDNFNASKELIQDCTKGFRNKGLIARKSGDERVAEVTLALDRKRIGNSDLCNLSKRVLDTFGWYENSIYKKYVSPSFAIIQSSGMGKTKLMFEFKKQAPEFNILKNDKQATVENEILKDIKVFYVLCNKTNKALPDGHEKYYDKVLQIDHNIGGSAEDRVKNRSFINDFLNTLIKNVNNQHVVIMFDECKRLQDENSFLYVSISWWLRRIKKRNNKLLKVVAVFAGTMCSLNNFQLTKPPSNSSRDPSVRYFNYEKDGDKNKQMYDPFFEITTVALGRRKRESAAWKRDTYYEDELKDIRKFGRYGRPLFAELLRKGEGEKAPRLTLTKDCAKGNVIKNDILYSIVERMMLSESWEKPETWASILSHRIELGTASFKFARESTSKGYAVLFDYSASIEGKDDTVVIGYPVEPLCSAMAMGLMTETWTLKDDYHHEINGKKASKWVEKLGEVYDKEIFKPDIGDGGELFAALYLLLCGDAVRCVKDPLMREFEIDAQEWVQRLFEDKTGTTDSSLMPLMELKNCTTNCIQIVRNEYRSNCFLTHSGLENMYELAIGSFVYNKCPAIDLVLPLKQENTYHPLCISVKCQERFTQSEANAAIKSMENFIKRNNNLLDENSRVFYLLIIIRAQDSPIKKSIDVKHPGPGKALILDLKATSDFGIVGKIWNRAMRSQKTKILKSQAFSEVQREILQTKDNCEPWFHSKANEVDKDVGRSLIKERQESLYD